MPEEPGVLRESLPVKIAHYKLYIKTDDIVWLCVRID